ncbi:hypothetical protein [Armatimonas sp.]|uniref:hypothetical protein n=1 Tax=Armatimonas sp. TaxID=1872638 RepID=UPI0037519CFC
MQIICLVPLTPAGDELGYLPLLDFIVTDAGAGEGMAVPSMLRSQLEVLQELIYCTLESEGLKPVEDELGLRLTISEALAFAGEEAPVELRLVVRPVASPSPESSLNVVRPAEGIQVPGFDWNTFFETTGK